MSKYKIPVTIQTTASRMIGDVECDSLEEFEEKAELLWEAQNYDSPRTNIDNDFDLGDWDISVITESDLKYYTE